MYGELGGNSGTERVPYIEEDFDLNYEQSQRESVKGKMTYNQTPDGE